jgi:hypothetical protein
MTVEVMLLKGLNRYMYINISMASSFGCYSLVFESNYVDKFM